MPLVNFESVLNMKYGRAIYWVRQDLRLADNPALVEAALHEELLIIYIKDEVCEIHTPMGEASQVWLHHSLDRLNQSIEGRLNIYSGDPDKIISELIERWGATALFWNRCYDPVSIQRDQKIKKKFKDQGLEVKSFNGSLLFEPYDVVKADGTPYKVFTPFYKNGCLKSLAPRRPLPIPEVMNLIKDEASLSLTSLDFLSGKRWETDLIQGWGVGEEEANKSLSRFLKEGIHTYESLRDVPAESTTSKLSIPLHFGEISPNQVWYKAIKKKGSVNVEPFMRELVWREFAQHLLFHFPKMLKENLQEKFDAFAWKKDEDLFNAWKKGQTGIPIVDAGMRELWQTGSMHNRVRMIVASFLVKNLMIDWREGEKWFYNCLFDADLASNSMNWQWVAGSGVDAAPFFRIFNPVTQAKKFDPEGIYIKSYVPELERLPAKYIAAPWEVSEEVLCACGIVLGKDYPYPIVDLKESRQQALEAFRKI